MSNSYAEDSFESEDSSPSSMAHSLSHTHAVDATTEPIEHTESPLVPVRSSHRSEANKYMSNNRSDDDDDEEEEEEEDSNGSNGNGSNISDFITVHKGENDLEESFMNNAERARHAAAAEADKRQEFANLANFVAFASPRVSDVTANGSVSADQAGAVAVPKGAMDAHAINANALAASPQMASSDASAHIASDQTSLLSTLSQHLRGTSAHGAMDHDDSKRDALQATVAARAGVSGRWTSEDGDALAHERGGDEDDVGMGSDALVSRVGNVGASVDSVLNGTYSDNVNNSHSQAAHKRKSSHNGSSSSTAHDSSHRSTRNSASTARDDGGKRSGAGMGSDTRKEADDRSRSGGGGGSKEEGGHSLKNHSHDSARDAESDKQERSGSSSSGSTHPSHSLGATSTVAPHPSGAATAVSQSSSTYLAPSTFNFTLPTMPSPAHASTYNSNNNNNNTTAKSEEATINNSNKDSRSQQASYSLTTRLWSLANNSSVNNNADTATRRNEAGHAPNPHMHGKADGHREGSSDAETHTSRGVYSSSCDGNSSDRSNRQGRQQQRRRRCSRTRDEGRNAAREVKEKVTVLRETSQAVARLVQAFTALRCGGAAAEGAAHASNPSAETHRVVSSSPLLSLSWRAGHGLDVYPMHDDDFTAWATAPLSRRTQSASSPTDIGQRVHKNSVGNRMRNRVDDVAAAMLREAMFGCVVGMLQERLGKCSAAAVAASSHGSATPDRNCTSKPITATSAASDGHGRDDVDYAADEPARVAAGVGVVGSQPSHESAQPIRPTFFQARRARGVGGAGMSRARLRPAHEVLRAEELRGDHGFFRGPGVLLSHSRKDTEDSVMLFHSIQAALQTYLLRRVAFSSNSTASSHAFATATTTMHEPADTTSATTKKRMVSPILAWTLLCDALRVCHDIDVCVFAATSAASEVAGAGRVVVRYDGPAIHSEIATAVMHCLPFEQVQSTSLHDVRTGDDKANIGRLFQLDYWVTAESLWVVEDALLDTLRRHLLQSAQSAEYHCFSMMHANTSSRMSTNDRRRGHTTPRHTHEDRSANDDVEDDDAFAAVPLSALPVFTLLTACGESSTHTAQPHNAALTRNARERCALRRRGCATSAVRQQPPEVATDAAQSVCGDVDASAVQSMALLVSTIATDILAEQQNNLQRQKPHTTLMQSGRTGSDDEYTNLLSDWVVSDVSETSPKYRRLTHAVADTLSELMDDVGIAAAVRRRATARYVQQCNEERQRQEEERVEKATGSGGYELRRRAEQAAIERAEAEAERVIRRVMQELTAKTGISASHGGSV